jgi:predicted RecB family nuclease
MNRDPILDWLDLYGNEENKDTKDKKYDANLDFVQLLFRKGHEFEYIVVNHLQYKFGAGNFVTVGADSKDPAKEQETLQHMKDGVPFILQGVLRNPDNKTYGIPDMMVRNDILSKIPENEECQSFFNIDASSELGNYHYRIIDVKFTTLNYNADGTYLLGSDAHKAQLAIYNQALGRMQGFLPPEAYLLGRNWKRTKNGVEIHGEGALDRLGVVDFFNIDRDFIQKANDAVEWIRRVRSEGSAWEVTPKPTVEELWPNCKNQSDYPWHNAKAKIADELNELTKVWQLGPKERERAHANGIFSWNDPDLTPEKIGITGPKRIKIMREVLKINNQDKFKVLPPKIFNNDRNWQKKPKLEFFVDFETVSNIEDDFVNFPRQGGQELIFMIGCGFERNRKFEIKVFTAKNLSIEEEARIITEWFDYMENVKNEILRPSAKLPNIFHWSPAELTFMGVAHDNLEGDEVGMLGNIYKERREMIENWKTLPWFDFLKVMKDEPIVVKGAFGFGLKAIAKKLEEHRLTKTTWKDGPVDGLGAMVGAWYCDRISREQGIDMDRTELMQGIREYNIIDCKAMWDLINYLRKHHT